MVYERIRFSERSVLVLSLILVLVSAAVGLADVRLPAVIGDNMVLQQGSKVPIWGWAEPGEQVRVRVSWLSMKWAVTADKDGKWMFKMNSPKAGGPYEMTIIGKNTITVKNILVGEVWVCSGQSNMAWPVGRSTNAEQEIAAADYPEIRLFTVEQKVADEPQDDCVGSWTLCSPQTIPDFSAVAYFFGRALHSELKVPIGLIHTSWGGTEAEAWTRKGVLEADQNYGPVLERHEKLVTNYPQAMKEYEQKLAEWEEIAAQAQATGKEVPRKPREPAGPGNKNKPSGLYNAMIAPLMPYGIEGVIWYQGERNANRGRSYIYRKLFPAMIGNWRSDWGQGKFPFLFVQLTCWRAVEPEPTESTWAELRESQLVTLSSVPNTGMAVIIDIGNANDIHPKNKQDVGKRLALCALAGTYNKKLVYSGPIYKSMKVDGNNVILNFEHVGGGLVADGGEALKGFAVAGADRKFVWADAEIKGETVLVHSDKVAEPAAVRYGWAHNPVCNLYNKEGLPASPFRTDHWPGLTFENR